MNLKENELEIVLLRNMIETSVSRKMKTPADFQFLTGVIQERCRETLGVTTLKRIWGYVDGYDTMRFSTLSILARCVGFRDWEDFLENHSRSGDSSNVVLGRSIATSELAVDSTMTITWAPDRRVLIRHLGNGNFVVLESANSKLKPTDTFHCSYFIIGEPLYLDNYVHGNNPPTLFMVGNKGGITDVERQ